MMEDPSFRDRVEPLDQEESGRSLNVNPFITSAAGALSGLLVDGIVHPLDTVRARIQTGALLITKTKATSISPSVLCSNNRTPTVLHCRNTLHAIISIIKLEGPRSLFNGFSSVALLSAPAHAIYFTIYEKTKALDLGSPFDSTAITNLSAGFAAEAAGALLWTPMDVIKQRMQIISRSTTQQHTTRASLSSTVGSIVELNGYTGLFRGYWIGLAVYGPLISVYFSIYEHLKLKSAAFLKKEPNQLNPIIYYGCGMIGGGISAVFTCPLDVIKTRYQVKNNTDADAYKGVLDCARRIHKTLGFRGFFLGLAPRILWISQSCGLTISSYELFKRIL